MKELVQGDPFHLAIQRAIYKQHQTRPVHSASLATLQFLYSDLCQTLVIASRTRHWSGPVITSRASTTRRSKYRKYRTILKSYYLLALRLSSNTTGSSMQQITIDCTKASSIPKLPSALPTETPISTAFGRGWYWFAISLCVNCWNPALWKGCDKWCSKT
eukprot:3272123-Amphidinium_carterae.1